MITKSITILNETFDLHPSGALFWVSKKMLLIADVHLGKVSHFRKYGSAVPSALINKNFELLDAVVTHYQPKVVCFLGDLFHSSLNKEWDYFSHWVQQNKFKVVLVVGNHDIISPLKYEALGVEVTDIWTIENFFLTHHPEEKEGLFNFSGHLHPGVRLQGSGRQFLKVPCYYQTELQMVLPAFGVFTGLFIVSPKEGDAIYATTDDAVILVS